jgi:O-methyltransferase
MASLIHETMLGSMRALAAGTPPGAFVEVGVYQGGSAEVLHGLAQEQGRALFLFDTFCGIPFRGEDDRHVVGDFADTSMADVARLCPQAVIVAGVFPASLVETGPVAFVHADADQYQSTRDICTHLAPRMVPGGVMLFDDFAHLDGCRRAVVESFPGYERLADGRAYVRF